MTTTTISLGKAAPVSRAELALNRKEQAWDHKVAKDNNKFHKAKPEVQRVIIAQDVLKWLGEGKITPSPGTYISQYLRGEDGDYLYQGDNLVDGRVKDDRVDGGRCAACALGAVFVCTVERIGGIDGFWGGLSSNQMCEKLAPYFSEDQLRLIEVAFERFVDGPQDPDGRAFAFGKKYDLPTPRMRAIMENIIANKGTFVP